MYVISNFQKNNKKSMIENKKSKFLYKYLICNN